MDMGDKIHKLRCEQELTLEELGNKVGVGKSTVRKWEKGIIANMKRDKIISVAEALDTTPAYLMGWEETTDPYWKNETDKEIMYHSFLHEYLDYDSPYTGDGSVDIILKSEPNTIYRVPARLYEDFYDYNKERIDHEFNILLERAEKISNNDEHIVPLAAHAKEVQSDDEIMQDIEYIKKRKQELNNKKNKGD